jgi:hypothetical protein
MTIEATACIVFLVLAVFSGVAYTRDSRVGIPGGPIKKKSMFFLWAVRILALIVLACAFFQPALKLQTIAADTGNVAVLIDASKSMGLFQLDSMLKHLPDLFGNTGTTARFFFFGDSLRPCNPATLTSGAFIDKNSFFPGDLSAWSTVVILSDGNWSNTSLPTNAFENKNCFYFPLPAMSPRPFLSCECISFPTPVSEDSVSRAAILVKGYKRSGDPLEIDVKSGAKRLFNKNRILPAGYFNDTLSLSFPTNKAGRFLYGIRIKNMADTLTSQVYLVSDVVPSAFAAAIISPSPALDERFLSLAISGDPSWKIGYGSDAARKADAMFFTEWDASSKKMFSLLKPSCVAVFVGCLPCSTRFTVTPDTFALIAADPDDSLARRIMQRSLPAPEQLVVCGGSAFSKLRTRLGCVARKKTFPQPGSRATQADTLPFIFEGVYSGRGFVAIAARNIWRMEFLPLGLDQENESGSLARDVIAIVNESIRGGLARSFFVYPSSGAGDSCAFSIVLPQELNVTPLPPRSRGAARIEFSIQQEGTRIIDTAFTPEPGELSGVQTFKCRSLPSGTYAYTAALSFDKKRFLWSDTLDVNTNDLELSISGQNTVLLGQLAVPLSGAEKRSFSESIGKQPGLARSLTNQKVYQIKRSWVLWGVIIALFSFEWFMRRKVGLDE